MRFGSALLMGVLALPVAAADPYPPAGSFVLVDDSHDPLAPLVAVADQAGTEYRLYADGRIWADGPQGKKIARLLEAGQPADLILDASGNLVALDSNPGASRLAAFRMGRTGVEVVRDVPLDATPVVGARLGNQVAVLEYRLSSGYAVALFDSDYDLSARIPVTFPCQELGPLVDLAASEAGDIYVASLLCGDTYVVNRYDLRGQLRQQFSPALPTGKEYEASADGRLTLIPAAIDVFTVEDHLVVLLNEPSAAEGAAADVWSRDGAKIGRVRLREIRRTMVRINESADGVVVVDPEDEVLRIDLRDRFGRAR
jgi:hypothetical protein